MRSQRPEVFVSYANHDRERVMALVSSLRLHGVSVWVDREGIAGGATWSQEIVQAIRVCKVLLLMCSDAAMRSRAVAQELQLAWKYRLRFLPLLLERLSLPEQFEFFLEGCQWIELLDQPIDRWLGDVLGALETAGVACSRPKPLGGSDGPYIQPRRPSAGLDGLWSLAKFTDRIWPLVVEGRSVSPQSVTYQVRAYTRPRPGARHKIRLGSRVFWAIEWQASASLLLLNHGSEGEIFCLCPSWFAPSTRLHPGVNVFPSEEARCEPFVVTGIPGRESVLAIITDEPMGLDWMPPNASVPARILSERDLFELNTILVNLQPDRWAVLATDFDVVVDGE